MANNLVVNLAQADKVEKFGGKAVNLAKLLQNNLPVPDGYAVSIDAFDANGNLQAAAEKMITDFLASKNNSESTAAATKYAVRSSGISEDAENQSWAGQFETFLNVSRDEVVAKVTAVHQSVTRRAQAYAAKNMAQKIDTQQLQTQLAVVIQEMMPADFAGVLFTKNPVTGADEFYTEYVAGLGESLVSGHADPETLVLNTQTPKTLGGGGTLPFDAVALHTLATQVKNLFVTDQDIEWLSYQGKIYLTQTRPITTHQQAEDVYYLGDPSELTYWGPSRAQIRYMSDFMLGLERSFQQMLADDKLPDPAAMLTLFHDDKVIFLMNAQEYSNFTKKMFLAYEKLDLIDQDFADWQKLVQRINQTNVWIEQKELLIQAWQKTELTEFSLYGAETIIIDRMKRFDEKTRQKIWGAFTTADQPLFLNALDMELADNQNPDLMAQKYPWIADGYFGIGGEKAAREYFQQRLTIVGREKLVLPNLEEKRKTLIEEFNLTDAEVKALTLVRKLIAFMDERKKWMMQSRHLIQENVSEIKAGHFYRDKKAKLVDKNDVDWLWETYVDFKVTTDVATGLVASLGAHHRISGEALVVTDPNQAVPPDKILVVPATSPSYVPMMRTCRALITDHGGIMSHAAIIAREFNLPCIVGTKTATKILQNGDQVLLDMVKGVVSKKADEVTS